MKINLTRKLEEIFQNEMSSHFFMKEFEILICSNSAKRKLNIYFNLQLQMNLYKIYLIAM